MVTKTPGHLSNFTPHLAPSPLKKCWFTRKLHTRMKKFKRKITLSVLETEQHCYRWEGVCAQRNDFKSESAVLFRNFCACPRDSWRIL